MSIKTLYEKDGTTPIVSATNVGYPQTTSTYTLTSGSEWTATGNGWVMAMGDIHDGGEVKIQVNGKLMFRFSNTSSTSQPMWTQNKCPVRAGQKIIATFPTGGGAYFYPDQET